MMTLSRFIINVKIIRLNASATHDDLLSNRYMYTRHLPYTIRIFIYIYYNHRGAAGQCKIYATTTRRWRASVKMSRIFIFFFSYILRIGTKILYAEGRDGAGATLILMMAILMCIRKPSFSSLCGEGAVHPLI